MTMRLLSHPRTQIPPRSPRSFAPPTHPATLRTFFMQDFENGCQRAFLPKDRIQESNFPDHKYEVTEVYRWQNERLCSLTFNFDAARDIGDAKEAWPEWSKPILKRWDKYLVWRSSRRRYSLTLFYECAKLHVDRPRDDEFEITLTPHEHAGKSSGPITIPVKVVSATAIPASSGGGSGGGNRMGGGAIASTASVGGRGTGEGGGAGREHSRVGGAAGNVVIRESGVGAREESSALVPFNNSADGEEPSPPPRGIYVKIVSVTNQHQNRSGFSFLYRLRRTVWKPPIPGGPPRQDDRGGWTYPDEEGKGEDNGEGDGEGEGKTGGREAGVGRVPAKGKLCNLDVAQQKWTFEGETTPGRLRSPSRGLRNLAVGTAHSIANATRHIPFHPWKNR